MKKNLEKLFLITILIFATLSQTAFAFDMQFIWDLGFNAITLILTIAAVLFVIGALLITRALMSGTAPAPAAVTNDAEEISEDDTEFDGTVVITLLGVNVNEKLESEISDTLSVGRHTANNLVISDTAISGKHCTIIRRGRRIFITDNNSTNGTFVNNARVRTETEIKDRDVIQMGKNQYKAYIKF